jgi:hypothetical protein
MRSFKYAFATLAVVFVAAICAVAQTSPGNINALEDQAPKPGMTQQYEQGRKQKAEWHKQQKDPSALLVFEVVSGERTGSYVVARGGLHWADLDHPSVPEAADDEEYNKTVAPYVASITDSYFEFLPKFSNPDNSPLPPAYAEILILRVKTGKDEDFRAALGRIADAQRKVNPSSHASIFELVNGGYSGTYAVSLPRPHWADFEANPNAKSIPQALTEVFGADEANATMSAIDNAVESEYSEIFKFRQDLSYIPAQ